MSSQVAAAIIAASVGVLTLIATVVTQYHGRRATSRDTQKALDEQRKQLDRTLAEQRTRALNERFATAAGQLGDDKPPAVRLAGVYAMAGLADDWEENRQACVDVLCAYLRLPYEPDPGTEDVLAERAAAYRAGREVRYTVIRVITTHLQADAAVPWHGLNFDFRGAIFDGGDFRGAVFSGGRAVFDGAVFSGGELRFFGARFSGGTIRFLSAEFSGSAINFDLAHFSGGMADFGYAVFSGGEVSFNTVFSGGEVYFTDGSFSGSKVSFPEAQFIGGLVSFNHVSFSGGEVSFPEASFDGGEVTFVRAAFSGSTVDFDRASFGGGQVDFGDAFSAVARSTSAAPRSSAVRSASAPGSGAALSPSNAPGSLAARSTSAMLATGRARPFFPGRTRRLHAWSSQGRKITPRHNGRMPSRPVPWSLTRWGDTRYRLRLDSGATRCGVYQGFARWCRMSWGGS